MSFYSARNINIKIGGSGVFIKDASLSSNSSLSPVQRVGSSVSEEFKVDAPLHSSLTLNYFITGSDPIKNNMINEESSISVDFGGLSLNSGYLESYAFSASPYQPVEVSASLKFFEPVKGSFSPSASSLSSESKGLVFSDFEISQTGILGAGEIVDMSYSYTNSIEPSYVTQEEGEESHAHNVTFGKKNIELSFNTDNLQDNLPETGILGTAAVSLNGSDGTSYEVFKVNGRIVSQDTKAGQGGFVLRTLKVIQSNLGNPPVILSVSPTDSVPKGNLVIIQGQGFEGVQSVRLLDQEVDFLVTGTTSISFDVPEDSHIGPLSVQTLGGEATFSGISVT